MKSFTDQAKEFHGKRISELWPKMSEKDKEEIAATVVGKTNVSFYTTKNMERKHI